MRPMVASKEHYCTVAREAACAVLAARKICIRTVRPTTLESLLRVLVLVSVHTLSRVITNGFTIDGLNKDRSCEFGDHNH